jgi:hypothetical protein
MAVILAILTIILSSYPCCIDGDPDNGGCGIENSGHPEDSDDPTQEMGLCSPFYSCGNCTGFDLCSYHLAIPLADCTANDVRVAYKESSFKEVCHLTFKPPKVI